jgi:hypothetical protein
MAYSAWLLEFLLPTGVSPMRAPVRELTAAGNPYRDVFRVAEVVSGVAFLLAGPPLVRSVPVHWTARLTSATVPLFGLVLLVDTVHPMDGAVELLTNLTFVLGTGSLVLWWPPGWRSMAIAGLALVLLIWLGTLVLRLPGPEHFTGLCSRVQMAFRALALAVGTAYLLRDDIRRH